MEITYGYIFNGFKPWEENKYNTSRNLAWTEHLHVEQGVFNRLSAIHTSPICWGQQLSNNAKNNHNSSQTLTNGKAHITGAGDIEKKKHWKKKKWETEHHTWFSKDRENKKNKSKNYRLSVIVTSKTCE